MDVVSPFSYHHIISFPHFQLIILFSRIYFKLGKATTSPRLKAWF